jgi:hypothetical protein
MSEQKPLPTIWRTPDKQWEIIEPILKVHETHQRAQVVRA